MILIKFLFLGFCTALLFPPFFILPLGFFIFPYFYKLLLKLNQILSMPLYFFSGIFYGLGFFSIFLIWIKNPFLISDATKNYAFFSSFLIIFISFIFGLVFILFKYTRNFSFQIFCIPLFLIVAEIFIANFWYGFPWLTFALIISNNSIGSYFLYLFGTHATGFLLLNLFFIPQLFILREKIFVLFKPILVIILLIFIITLLIHLINYKEITKQKFKEIKVELFQMNNPIFNNNLSEKEKYKEIVTFIKNSEADLIVFAENNFPYIVNDIHQVGLDKLLKPNQTLIIGATRNANDKYFNTLLVLEQNNTFFFDKKILVPFGEFIPFRYYFSFMDFIAGSSDFDTGSKDRFIEIKDQYSFIPIICYEIIFFWKLLNETNDFSDLIVNITNDAWFGDFFGPYQHLYLTKMRAAEFNKPLIRVSNNGISAIFDNNGKILSSTKLNKREIINFNLEVGGGLNLIFFHKILNIFLIFFFLANVYFLFFKKNENANI